MITKPTITVGFFCGQKMRNNDDLYIWKAPTPEIKQALEDVFCCVSSIIKSGCQRQSKNEKRNGLIDARIQLVRLHKERMYNALDRARADSTIKNLMKQKTEPPVFVDQKPLPVFSR